MHNDKKTLADLLRTREGCAYVAAELVIATENHGSIYDNDPDHVPDSTVQDADLVLHITKSRETKEGWLYLRFPVGSLL